MQRPRWFNGKLARKLQRFGYEVLRHSGKSKRHADSYYKIPNWDLGPSLDQAQALTRSAEAMDPRHSHDEASDTERPNRPHTSEGKESVTHMEWNLKPRI